VKVVKTDSGKGITDQLEPVLDMGIYARCSQELSKHAERAFADAWLKTGIRLDLIGPSSVIDPSQDTANKSIPDGLQEKDGMLLPDKDVSVGLPVRTVKMDSRQQPFNGHADKLAAFQGYMLARHLQKQIDALSAKYGKFRAKRTPVEAYMETPIKYSKTVINGLNLCEEHPLVHVRLDLIPDLGLTIKVSPKSSSIT